MQSSLKTTPKEKSWVEDVPPKKEKEKKKEGASMGYVRETPQRKIKPALDV